MSSLEHLYFIEGIYFRTVNTERESERYGHVKNVLLTDLRVNWLLSRGSVG